MASRSGDWAVVSRARRGEGYSGLRELIILAREVIGENAYGLHAAPGGGDERFGFRGRHSPVAGRAAGLFPAALLNALA